MKKPIQKNHRCKKCDRLFFGNPYVNLTIVDESKKVFDLKYLCNICKDEISPLKSGKPRKSNRVKDIAERKREEYSKKPNDGLICEKCGKEFYGKAMSFTKKVKHKLVPSEICLCHDCQKEYLQNPEILNNI